MREVLPTGSNDREYAYDALIGGTYHGAMTDHAIKAIRAAKGTLTDAQLQGKSDNRRRQIFT